MNEKGRHGPAFFLSYAREDEDASDTIKRLYQDLTSRVGQRLGPAYMPGFMDTHTIEPGAEWRDELRQALGTANAFVAVLSPTYFSREYCGKEWAAFSSRLIGVLTPDGSQPRLMQPVLLVPSVDLRPMPEVVASRQYTFESYPQDYSERGLRYVHTLPSQVDTYERFIFELTDVLVKAIRTTTLPTAQLPPVSDIASAFHNLHTNTQRVVQDTPPATHLFAQFVYIAAKPSELSLLRQHSAPYGENGGLEWQPFLPPVDREIGMIAAEVASRERFRYEFVTVDERLIERLSEAARANKVIVVVVDPWTVRLDTYNQLMRELDDRNLPGCVVVVPLNTADTESSEQHQLLRHAVEATFVNRQVIPDPEVFLPWISTVEDFENQLATALQRAKLRVLSRQQILQHARKAGIRQGPPLLNALVP
jgi:FxsC-like protein